MIENIEVFFFSFSILIILSLLIARFSNNLGVPVLLLFLGVGMLAGSEGPGGIYFDDPHLSQIIGIVSLNFILFSGGLDTHWKVVRPTLWSAISLATIGVVLTTVLVGLFTYWLFDLPIFVSLLLGSIVASTDAAAVFSIIGARNINLKGNITPLLELESGSNDPMAVFLTVGFIGLIKQGEHDYWYLAIDFVKEMGIGLIMGLVLGKLIVLTINKIKFPIEGFYAVFVLAASIFVYTSVSLLEGSGFLAVYIAGMMVGSSDIVFKKNIFRFFDGLAWLAQIAMFITLGLLVFPSQILPAFNTVIIIAIFLIFIARPVAVFISLMNSKYSLNEKIFISWVGLRGAVPIVLATFPLIAGVSEAQWIFNAVFFIVITSALFQGWSIPLVAKLLNLNLPPKKKTVTSSEFANLEQTNRSLVEFTVPDSIKLTKKSLVEVNDLKGSLIVTIKRQDHYFVPSGSTILEAGDVIQLLVDNDKLPELKRVFENN